MAHTYGGGGRIPSSGTTTTSNPATASINLPAGTTVLWVSIVCGGTTARAGGDPTFNSVALTQRTAKTDSGGTPEVNTEDWYILEPDTGSSYTLSIPNSGGLAMAIAYGYASAATDYTSRLQKGGVLNGSSTNPSATLTGVLDGAIWFGAVGNGATTWNPSARSGTQINDWDAGSWGRGAQYGIKSGTGDQTISWTFGTTEDWVITGIAFDERHNKYPYLVGSASGSGTGSSYNIDVSGLGILEDDIIVVSASQVSNTNVSVGCSGDMSGAYQTLGGEVYSDETNYDTNFEMFYQVAGATPDTTITISRVNDAASGGSATVSIWRNADTTQPFETAGTPSTGGNTSRGTPPAKTPTVAYSVVISAGSGSQSSAGSAPTVPSNMTSIVTVNGNGSSADNNNFQAYFEWVSGTFTPNAWTGGADGTDHSWAAQTVVLRPVPDVSLAIDSSSYTLTNTAISLLKGSSLSIDSGSYSLTNTDINFLFSRVFSLDSAAYALTNTDILFNKGYALSLDNVAFTLTNTDILFPRGYVFPVDSASYSLTNTDLSLLFARLFGIDSGSFNLTNADINFNKGYALSLDNAAFTLTNTDITFPRTYIFPIDSAGYALTNTDQTFLRGYVVSLDSTSYSLTNTNISLLKGFVFPISSGSFNVSGTNVSFNRGYIVVLDTAAYLVTGTGLVFSITEAPIVDIIRRSFSQPQHRISSSQAQYRGSRSRRDPYG